MRKLRWRRDLTRGKSGGRGVQGAFGAVPRMLCEDSAPEWWGWGRDREEARALGRDSGWSVERSHRRVASTEMTFSRQLWTANLQDKNVTGSVQNTLKWPGKKPEVALESHWARVEARWAGPAARGHLVSTHCACVCQGDVLKVNYMVQIIGKVLFLSVRKNSGTNIFKASDFSS